MLVALILHVTGNLYYVFLASCWAKVYSNSCLVILNNRPSQHSKTANQICSPMCSLPWSAPPPEAGAQSQIIDMDLKPTMDQVAWTQRTITLDIGCDFATKVELVLSSFGLTLFLTIICLSFAKEDSRANSASPSSSTNVIVNGMDWTV